MRKMTQCPWVMLLLTVSFIMVTACATTPKGGAPEPAESPKADAAAGIYTHPSPAFSVEYPKHWVKDPVRSESEVLYAVNTNQWKIPNLAVSVTDLEEGAELSAKAYIAGLKESYPKAKRFKVFEEEMITLNDGTQAVAFTFKWNWTDGVTKLQSAALMVFKDGKSISCTSTTVFGGDTTPDKLLEYVKSFKFL